MAHDTQDSELTVRPRTSQSSAFAARVFALLVALSALAEGEALAHWQNGETATLVVAGALATMLGTFGWLLARQIRWTELQFDRAHRELQQSALQDALTGIGNRRLFDDALQREHRRAARTETPLALLMLDVDHFKSFNDTYGHPAGDACLRTVAAAIARLAQRPADLAARYGGEEFAILLPETDVAGAVAIAERGRDAMRRLGLEHAGGLNGIVTVSIGVAVIWPRHPDEAAGELVRLADAALYAAKAGGRNRACVAPDGGAAPLPADASSFVISAAPLAVWPEARPPARSS